MPRISFIHKAVTGNQRAPDIVQAARIDHVAYNLGMLVRTRFFCQGDSGKPAILPRGAPAQAEHLLKPYRWSIVLVGIIEFAASTTIKQGAHCALVRVRASKCDNTADTAAAISATNSLKESADGCRRVGKDDGIN